MYKDRLPLYKQLEKIRGSKFLLYVTGDRRNMETQIHSEVIPFLINHLDLIGSTSKISLYLYTRGGETLAAWSIANLLYQFCEEYEVIVPFHAHSSGTLLCLGAKTVIMTKQATLGPIDPSLTTPLNPQPAGSPPNVRVPVSVEAINGYFDLAKEKGITYPGDLTNLLLNLSSHIHPIVLGQVYRTRNQIRMLGRRLLNHNIHDEEQINKVLDFLCSESGSHDYSIYKKEAKEELGLNIETPPEDQYKIIKQIYEDISSELLLSEPFDPNVILGKETEVSYRIPRAIVESSIGGSHKFVSSGLITKGKITDPGGVIREVTQDNRISEGWQYEKE